MNITTKNIFIDGKQYVVAKETLDVCVIVQELESAESKISNHARKQHTRSIKKGSRRWEQVVTLAGFESKK